MGGDSVKGIAGHCLISRDFAERVDLNARHERYLDMFPRDWIADYATERCSAIRPNLTAGRERYARLAAGAQVEARDPFLDKRVVEYCAHLPGRMRLGNGWPKIILREVMEGRLPDEVRWSRGKPHLGWEFNAAMAQITQRRGQLDIDWLRKSLAPYVDPAALKAAWQAFDKGGDAELIHSATVLAMWLQENDGRPGPPDGICL
jgi:asparagine synthase (glutamine-hydrolysing)